jgi:hypothetical protein
MACKNRGFVHFTCTNAKWKTILTNILDIYPINCIVILWDQTLYLELLMKALMKGIGLINVTLSSTPWQGPWPPFIGVLNHLLQVRWAHCRAVWQNNARQLFILSFIIHLCIIKEHLWILRTNVANSVSVIISLKVWNITYMQCPGKYQKISGNFKKIIKIHRKLSANFKKN